MSLTALVSGALDFVVCIGEPTKIEFGPDLCSYLLQIPESLAACCVSCGWVLVKQQSK